MPNKKRSEFITQVKRLVRKADAAADPNDAKEALDRAIETYSRHNQRAFVIDIQGDGTGVIKLSDLTGYTKRFSGNPRIEWPISTEGKPEYIDDRAWIYYDDPIKGRCIRLLEDKPGATDSKMRFTYNILHVIDEDQAKTTVPTEDFYSLSKLGAAENLEQLSRLAAHTTEGQFLDVDMNVFQLRTDKYQTTANKLRSQYADHMGIGKKEDSTVGAANVVVNWDTTNSLGGDRFTHRRRYR